MKQTADYPDHATRRFLHLLENDPEMKDIPFPFISDRDPSAFGVFECLKYGTESKAYMSRFETCTRLQWAGLSIETWRQIAAEWPARELKEWVSMNPGMPESEKDRHFERVERKTDASMIDYLATASARLNSTDKNTMRHFYRTGVFTEQPDPRLFKELQNLGMSRPGLRLAVRSNAPGEKTPLALARKMNRSGIEEVVLAELEKAVPLTDNDDEADDLPRARVRKTVHGSIMDIDDLHLSDMSVSGSQREEI